MQNRIKITIVLLLVIITQACTSNPKSITQSKAIEIENRAEELYKNANLMLAEAEYRQLIKIAPRYAKAWFRLGNIYMRSNQLEAAIAHYEKAIEIEPKNDKAWHNLAIARLRQSTATVVEGLTKVEKSHAQELNFLLKKLLSIQKAS